MSDKTVKIKITEREFNLLKKGKAIVYKASGLGLIELSIDEKVIDDNIPSFLEDLLFNKKLRIRE